MMHDNAIDWIPISLKFRGKCIECGKELISGRALWSKSTKSVKHIECSQGNADQETSTGSSESVIHGQQIKAKNKQHEETPVQKCFICDKWFDDEYTSLSYPNYIEGKSNSYVCQSCIQNENAFENYKKKFLQKIKKSIK
jgi:hypothetical protein